MVISQEEHLEELSKGYRFDWKDKDHSVFEPKRGLNERWSRRSRRSRTSPSGCASSASRRCKHFEMRPMPWWGADLSDIDFQNIFYFIRSTEKQAQNWEDLPEDIKGTWDKLGIPEAEKKYLGGVSAQYESEVVYHKIKKELDDMGVLFTDMDSALRDYPDLVKEYFGTIIPPNDNKFAALNTGRVVGRVVHLRAARRAGRHPAAGLLPDQRREHGPVRAHADHRRRGQLRALRRGLLGADLHDRLAALGRGRDHGEEGRARPVHHDPELVDQRLQPGHQARDRRTRTPSWNGSTATSGPRSP